MSITLESALSTLLSDRDFSFKVDGMCSNITMIIIAVADGTEVWISDVNSGLSGTLDEYAGLQAFHYPAPDRGDMGDAVPLYISPDLGDFRPAADFTTESTALLDAVEALLRTSTLG